jgi:hypothetical protein
MVASRAGHSHAARAASQPLNFPQQLDIGHQGLVVEAAPSSPSGDRLEASLAQSILAKLRSREQPVVRSHFPRGRS